MSLRLCSRAPRTSTKPASTESLLDMGTLTKLAIKQGYRLREEGASPSARPMSVCCPRALRNKTKLPSERPTLDVANSAAGSIPHHFGCEESSLEYQAVTGKGFLFIGRFTA